MPTGSGLCRPARTLPEAGGCGGGSEGDVKRFMRVLGHVNGGVCLLNVLIALEAEPLARLSAAAFAGVMASYCYWSARLF
jgi:hypothetical protein